MFKFLLHIAIISNPHEYLKNTLKYINGVSKIKRRIYNILKLRKIYLVFYHLNCD